jgi:sigma-E factor negative regulatory protein RseA
MLMHNDVNEKISMFVDGELSYDESSSLLKLVNSDEALKKRLMRYQAISQVLQTEHYQELQLNFSDKIAQQIRQEPAYLLPQAKRPIPRKKLFAMAASTIAAAVLVGEAVKMNQGSMQAPMLIAGVSSTKQSANPPAAKTAMQQKPPMTAQFNDYLQAHNSSIYTNGEVDLKTYAKVASYK